MPQDKHYAIDISALHGFLRFASIFILLLSMSMSPIVMAAALPSILSVSSVDNRMLAFAQQSATEQPSQQQQQLPSDKIISNHGKIAELAKFNPQAQELPEGLALHGRYAYVSLSPLIQVLRIQLPAIPLPLSAISPLDNNTNNSYSETISGQSQNLTYSPATTSINITKYGAWPKIPSGKGNMLGLSIDDKGNLFAAIASQTDKVKTGVYRLGPSGIGNATLVATSPEMKLPNDIVFGNTTTTAAENQQQNNSNSSSSKNSSPVMYVSDSGSGIIFRVLSNGTTERWASSPLLQGNKTYCPDAPQLGMDIGANGMTFDGNGSSMFVTNTDKASVVRIPILSDGSAGNPEVFVGPDCEKLAGADGMVMNLKDNSLYVAVNKLNAIAKVSLDDKRTITIFASGGALDFPASLELGTSPFSTATDANVANSTGLYITNFAMISAQKNQTSANPGLLKSDIFER